MKILPINNGTAKKVLAEIKRLAKNNSSDTCLSLDAYVNCREQGFALSEFVFGRKAVFSENRGSDDIVVYIGKLNDFEFNTNIPNEKVWKDATYFKPYEVTLAANYILEKLEA